MLATLGQEPYDVEHHKPIRTLGGPARKRAAGMTVQKRTRKIRRIRRTSLIAVSAVAPLLLASCVINPVSPGLTTTAKTNLVAGHAISAHVTKFLPYYGAASGDSVKYYMCNVTKTIDDGLSIDELTVLANDCLQIGTTQTLVAGTNGALSAGLGSGVIPSPTQALGVGTDPDTACAPTPTQIANEADVCALLAVDVTHLGNNGSNIMTQYLYYKPSTAPAEQEIAGDVSISGGGFACQSPSDYDAVGTAAFVKCSPGETLSVKLAKAGVAGSVTTYTTASVNGTYNIDLGTLAPGTYKATVTGITSKLVSPTATFTSS